MVDAIESVSAASGSLAGLGFFVVTVLFDEGIVSRCLRDNVGFCKLRLDVGSAGIFLADPAEV